MQARAHCYTCDKVASLCLCGRITPITTRTRVSIVQHWRERRHPFGTVRIARLGLPDARVHEVDRALRPIAGLEDAVVLFPDAHAPSLDALPVAAHPRHLVAIDGTWAHAARLRREHPSLRGLPAVRLPEGQPSRYRIRREPSPEAISTIEALVRALRVLEPGLDLDGLLDGFDAMIDDQLARRATHPYTPRHPKRRRRRQPSPEVFRRESHPLVLLHVELHRPRGQRAYHPIRVTAARPRPRALVDVLVRGPIAPSALRLRNLELGSRPFERSGLEVVSPDALAGALRRLLRPDDAVVAWTTRPGALLRELGLTQPVFSAKTEAARTWDSRGGPLARVVESLGGAGPPWAPGRAGRELSHLATLMRAMRAEARGD